MTGIRGQRSAKPNELPSRYTEAFLDELDGRGKVCREMKARLAELVADYGGAETLSYARNSLARRAIFLESQIESIEVKLARGEEVKPEEVGRWTQGVNTLLGLYKTLGLERRARDLMQTPAEWLRGEAR